MPRNIFFKRRRYARLRQRFTPSFAVSDETRRSIIILCLFSLGIVSILSYFNIAGRLGEITINLLSLLFGEKLILFVAIFFWLCAFVMLFPERYKLNAANYLGMVLLILSITGFTHLSVEPSLSFAYAKAGLGGGLLGLIFSYPLLQLTSQAVAIVLLVAIFFLSLVLMFNTSLENIISVWSLIIKGILIIAGLITKALALIKNFVIQAFRNMIAAKKERYEASAGQIENEIEVEKKSEAASDDYSLPSWEVSKIGAGKNKEQIQKQPTPPVFRHKGKAIFPLNLLDTYSGKPTSGDVKANQEVIKKTLESFNIIVEMGEVTVGPTITRYTLKPSSGVKLAKISSLHNDLALALAAHPIRIEAPIPGQSFVGIEVPNKAVALVKLREILESDKFKKRTSNLMVAIGRDVSGNPWVEDLGAMPHMLVAGATGSGKSVALNTIITSLLYQNHPNELKFILIDPKRVELTTYRNVAHLLTPVIMEIPKIVNALKWSLKEMERRLALLHQSNKKNIDDYNRSFQNDPIPYIVIVIDELADLMAASYAEVEGSIIRLAQMARAAGIHLVIATQRPSVDVITGLIKANVTNRIAFSVPSAADSRTIIDASGAEKLIGRGDMLFSSPKLSKPKRLQGAYLTENEITRVVDYLQDNFESEFDDSIVEKQTGVSTLVGSSWSDDGNDEELLEEAILEVKNAQKASATFLQRRLRIGYARAARILDLLEERGLIGPADGAKARDVLIPCESGDNIEEPQ